MTHLRAPVLDWYAANARDLPWRRPGDLALVGPGQRDHAAADPGGPGAARPRGLAGPLADARRRWPPATPADAVRQWDRLGYPRRAVRLHASAQRWSASTTARSRTRPRYLRALPGVGSYTAAAVASFAFGQRHAVLDTNVRRVLARLVTGDRPAAGRARPRPRSRWPSRCCRRRPRPPLAGRSAVMELGALVCTAARPGLRGCPVGRPVRVAAAGRPAAPARRAAARLRGQRPAVPGRACWRCCARRTGRCRPRRWTAAWARLRAASACARCPDRRWARQPGARTAIASPCPGAASRRYPRLPTGPATASWRPGRTSDAPVPSAPPVAAALVSISAGGASGTASGLVMPLKMNFASSPVALGVDDDDLARLELAEQDLLRQVILDLPLDRPPQRPGAEHRVVAPLGQQLLGRRPELDAHVAVLAAARPPC